MQYQDALRESIEYFNGEELPAKVFLDKYALRDLDDNILEPTPEFMHRRLAKEFARIESTKFKNPLTEEEIFSYFDRFKYIIPQGSPIFAIGNNYQYTSASNCFVVSAPDDSYGGICKTDEQIAQISKRRGGVGVDLSTLRPNNSTTNNSSRKSTGVKTWMQRYSNTIREVGQGGRRGALMETLSVHHPDIEEFITAKNNDTDVTGANISVRVSDEFLKAVENNEEYELRFPINSTNVVKKINARYIWDKIIHNAWLRAEPGVLFWDNIINDSPADCYKDCGFETTSTNPCMSGDTLIATADGRNVVSIKQLAEEKRDVPVYSVNTQTGIVEIKMGRNPRKTGTNKEMVRVHLDDGSYFDVTTDHKCPLKTGETKEAKDLVNGDSLFRFSKFTQPFNKNGKDYYHIKRNLISKDKDRIVEHREIAKFYNPEIWETKYNTEKNNGWMNGGIVIHHKDHNGLNNSPDNLEIMSFKDHCKLHASIDTQGEKNGRYSGYTNQQIEDFALELTKNYGRRISVEEWEVECEELNIPKAFSSFRRDWFKTPKELLIYCANKLGYENTERDPRLVKTLQFMLEQGYDAEIVDNYVLVSKKCEICGKEFKVEHNRREQSMCSIKCSNKYLIITDGYKRGQKASQVTKAKKQEQTKLEQSKIYSLLKFKLGREPKMSEWELACKSNNIPCRIGKTLKYGYKNYKEVKQAGELYNHKVVSVEFLPAKQDVYNITVDDNHNLAIVTDIKQNKRGNNNYSGIFISNCGELPLSDMDSCRLMAINLTNFVVEHFKNTAKFDFDKLYHVSIVAQRLMDDLVDLELERIDQIITKIKSDPENKETKSSELKLWSNIRKACYNGRRTGLGITGMGDTLACLNIKYGSDESIDICEKIYQTIKFGSYASSVGMAKELGSFPVWSWDKEKDNPFLNRIKNENIDFISIPLVGQDLYDNIQKYGRRNISNLTTAPTGTVSIISMVEIDGERYFNISSGIEPVYSLSFTRRKKGNPGDKDFRSDFVDQNGDHWMNFEVYHQPLKAWMKIKQSDKIEESPYFQSTAEEVIWTQRVKLQASAQRHVDHSISSTVNLPNNISKEEVEKIYNTAWKDGCKGITVYRDGCRTGVLIKNEPKIVQTDATKRPKVLDCDIYNFKHQDNKYTVIVGLLEKCPYEVFCISDHIEKHKSGKLVKESKGKYKLKCEEDELELTNYLENDAENALLRMISTALRHGSNIKFIVEQLNKTKGDLTSFTKCIARALKRYINDGDNSTESCPNCDSKLIYQEGCLRCDSCGFSKCG